MSTPHQPTVHLVANAHLDPVWLWQWEEGAAEAMSTFRTAADFCEAYDGFIFNHNEAVLYEWIEEYEPALFERIRRLVKEGRWHIMGGWYLQPDTNMPGGEGLVRQALVGKRYFIEKFGVEPRTVINFDPFGHDRGLVQIIARSGSDAYIHCRPGHWEYQPHPLPGDLYRWVGYDGSSILACRAHGSYLSGLGEAAEKIERFFAERWDAYRPHGLVLWGIGDHGGGPSRIDMQRIGELMQCRPQVRHSTPDAFFDHVRAAGTDLPEYAHDVRPWGVGCYTSMAKIKSGYRRLESELLLTEKMAAHASLRGLMDDPARELRRAEKDLLFTQFHDIIPGSCIEPAERDAVRRIDHGLEALSRVRARAFFALAAGQPTGDADNIPVLVYNPHPYPVTTTVECEFNLQTGHPLDTWFDIDVTRGGKPAAAQVEQHISNVYVDWRKRVAVHATLPAASMTRFDCRPIKRKAKPKPRLKPRNGQIRFKGEGVQVTINTRSGLIDRFAVGRREVLGARACRPLIVHDSADPWGVGVRRFGKVVERFKVMNKAEAAAFAGLEGVGSLDPVRVIEDGPARVVVEALLKAGDSRAAIRYLLPRHGTQIGVELAVNWRQTDQMLKLELPVNGDGHRFLGQGAYGTSELPTGGDEAVARQWVAVVDDQRDVALTVINDATYGCDYKAGRLRLSLLRSPAYSCLPHLDRKDHPMVLPTDRRSPRIDQGWHSFRFWLDAGPVRQRLDAIDREALACNERPVALSFMPSGDGERPGSAVTLSDKVVQCSAFKRAADGSGDVVVRLFNPTAKRRRTTLRVPCLGVEHAASLGGFEIHTLRIDARGQVRAVDLLER